MERESEAYLRMTYQFCATGPSTITRDRINFDLHPVPVDSAAEPIT